MSKPRATIEFFVYKYRDDIIIVGPDRVEEHGGIRKKEDDIRGKYWKTIRVTGDKITISPGVFHGIEDYEKWIESLKDKSLQVEEVAE